MSFSDWTKKRKQQNAAANETTTTKEQSVTQATASAAASNIARDDKPSSFGEWTRKSQGVTAWRDEEVGFNDWLDSLSKFSTRVSDDYSKRDGAYQSADTMGTYRDDTDRGIDALSQKSDAYKQYFTAYKSMYDELYGKDTVNQILSSLDEGSKYLSDVRGSLDKESDYWAQFENEDAYNEYQDVLSWQDLTSSADFEEKSRYDAEANASEKKMNILGTLLSGESGGIVYDDPGYKDLLLAYINGDKEAGAIIKNNDANMYSAGSGALGSLWAYATEGDQESQQMTDDEVKLFNYLYNTKGQDTAYKYYSYLQSDLYKRNREADEAQWSEYAKENPIGSSIFSTIMSPAKGLSYLSQAADYIGGGEIDQNAPSNKFSYIPTAIRNQVSDTIQNSGKWGGVGSFAYQTGMSMGDFLLNTAITGGNQAFALGVMGTGAAADATISAKDRGLSDNQAFALGTIAGAAEIITEKVSLDALLDKTALTKSAMGYFLKNTLAEGSEEVGSDFINLFADVLISKDKSQWQQSIDAYQSDGMGESDAFWHAVRDQAETMGLDFLGGAISGGVVSGGAIGINEAGSAYNAGKTGAEFNTMGDDVIQATIETGLESDPSTESYKLATQLQQKLNNGETVSNYELGRLYQANVRTVDAEQSGEELLRQAAEQVTQGTSITNRTASDILDNTRAVSILSEDAGLTLMDNMTKSQRRAAVKSAVEALASHSDAVSEPASEITQTTGEQTQAAQESTPVTSRPVAQQAYDIKRIQRSASALGENGAKALNAAYDGSVDAQDYYAGFSSYYEAGMSGVDMDKVQSEYSAQLNEAQRFAAYSSGQQDAAVSLAAEREGMNFVTVYGDEAGLVRNDYVAKLPKETAALYNRVARAVGVKIELADSVRGGTANGEFLPGKNTIRLAMDADNALDVVAAHEITHRLQQLAPEAYRKYRDYVMNYRTGQNQGGSASIVEAYRSNAADAGVNLTTEEAMDEIAADFTQELIENKDLFGELAKKDRSIAGKLLDAIKEFISKVKSVFRGNAAAQDQAARSEYGVDMKTLEEAARLWTEAYNTAEEQAKATTSGTVVGTEGGYAEVDGKFSLKGVVEDNGDLLALHNLTEQNLRDALKLGGLPMPSIAIVQARSGHAKYGPISLVFSKDTIDPKVDSANKVYGGDAFTPTAPPVEYPVNYDAVLKVERHLNELSKEIAGGMFASSSILRRIGVDEDSTSMTMDEIASKLSRDDAVRAAYLADKGETLEPSKNPKEFDNFGNDTLQDYIDEVGPQQLEKLVDDIHSNSMPRVYDTQRETVQHIIREGYRRDHASFLNKKPEFIEKRLDGFIENRASSPFRIEDFILHAWEFYQDGGTTKDAVDPSATRTELENRADTADVKAWIEPQLKGILGKPGIYNGKERFTASGNSRSFSALHWSYTLENIVKAMKSNQSERGEATFGFGAGSMISVATPSYKNIQEIKDDSGRLQLADDDTYKAMEKKLDDEIGDVITRVLKATKHHSDNQFEEMDIIGTVMRDAAQTSKTIDAIMKTFSKEGYKISNVAAKAMQDIFNEAAAFPTGYFEAKPQRAVGFDEVLAAVVPDDTSKELRSALSAADVNTLEYKSGDDADRLAKVNSVEGARFSLKTDSEGRNLTAGQQEYYQDSKVADDQGRLKVMFHASGAGDINIFQSGNSAGLIYFAFTERSAKAAARGKQKIYECYLNVTKPVNSYDTAIPWYDAEDSLRVSDWKRDGYDGAYVKDESGVSIAVFSPGQIKLTSNKTPTDDPDIRYSLKPVPPVQPTSDDWKPGASFDEVKAAHPTLFALDADEADTRNPTQITGTVKSYRKLYEALQAEGFDGTILDASSGLGYGTRAGREEYGFNVDDIEPFPDAKYTPMFMDYSALDKTYDVIINNAVLNVMPQDLRDALVVKMGQLLNPGGRAYINVRGTDVKNASSKVAINDDLMEYFISNTGSYQKGFTSRELVAYLKDALGDGFRVNPTNKFGGVSAIVTKDGRNSLKGAGNIQREMAALSEENDLLRDRVDYWKGQTKRTQRVTTDKKAVTQAARDLIRSYGADLETSEIAGDLQSLYDYISSGYDGKDELTYADARRRAEKIARTLVDNAVAVDDDQYRQHSDLRSYLRSTKLTLSTEDSHNIADYNDFRKRNFGRLNLGGGRTNVDQVYQELSELWPEFFDEQRESHPADQLLHIADVLDSIYDVTEYNPFSRFTDQATTGAANEIMEKFFELPQTRETFADRQARKLDEAKTKGRHQVQQVREQKDARMEELRKQNQQRVQDAIKKERVRREEQIDKLKTRYREKDAEGRERRSARELRAKIVRHANALSQKLLRPSDKQHIPENLRQATAAVLDAINRESAFAVDPDTGKRVKDGSGTPTKRTEAFRRLRLAYADITKDGGDYTLIIDPDLMDNLNELEAMRDTPLAEMGTQQLSTVWATLKAVEASIRTANTMLGTSRFETISQFADGIKNDNILRADRGNFKGILGKMDKLANLDMLTPQAYFHRMGNTGEELFRMLRTAQDRHISIMRDAQQATEKIVGKADINKLERETHTFDIGGEKLTMSTAQIMSLYELMKREQAQEHILIGGIRPDAINTRRSLRENRRSAPVHIGIDGFATITAVLTDEQIKMADGLQKYMGGALAELGNEASMEVYGYRKFNERDYFPIQVDKNQTKKDIAKEAQAATIAGRGFTKSVAPKANNAVMVNSIFDVYSSHVNDMATYAAWLPTMENVRRIRDFTFRDGEGARVGDVKTIIERVFGKNGNAYLNRLVDDINQGIRPNGTGNLTDGIVGNYKAAAVAANIRVILQQPTAILRALDTLDAKYLLQGAVKRGDWEKVMKYAPIARWKDWGYFDINTGRQMKDVLLNSDTVLERVRQAGMAMAGKADSFAWARLWNAVEAETKDTRPGLKPGTDEFYKAVAVRFSEIVDRTQVVDGLLQRSQIMRSPDALTKMSTSFMAEPTKTYNMFANAVYDVRHADSKQARSRAKSALARTTAALVTSFTVNALAQAIVDAMRDDDKEKDYWEKLLQAYTGFSGDEKTFLDYWNSFWDGNLEANFNPLSYLPYFKDLLSIAQGYDVTRMDMEAVEKVWTAATNMKKALTGEGKYTLPGATANLMGEAARMLGLPVANLKRDVQAAATTAAIETDNYLMQYRIDSALLNMGYSGNSGNFMDILYNASINDPGAYEIIYADMVKHGVEEDKIRTAMESRMKRDQGVESVKDLEARYLTPTQEKSYSGLHGKVSGTTVWTSASAEQREALEGDLYDLTVGNTAGEKLQEKIDSGSAYGISETDYLLYRLAQDVVSEDGNNNTSQEEAEAAIEMLSGLSDEARAYLWQSTNKGWKESGNPFK